MTPTTTAIAYTTSTGEGPEETTKVDLKLAG